MVGTIDSPSSEQIYEKLAELEHADRDNIHALENQTILKKKNFKIIFKPIEGLQKQQNKILASINRKSNYTVENFKNMGMQKRWSEFLSPTNSLFSIISNQINIVDNAVLKYFILINSFKQEKIQP